ncbi:MAG: PhoH family protein [bacterium]|nr:PhoH family protein [bacterium]
MSQDQVLVLDTNVLLNDPESLFDYPKARLILPLAVLDEMDQFKKEYNERGRNARRLAQILDQIRTQGRLTEGVTLENGAVLSVDVEENPRGYKGFSPHKGSNRVLLATLSIKERIERNVVLVTNDLNLRVRASALGIPVQSHDERGRNVDIYEGFFHLDPNAEQLRQLDKLGYLEGEDLRFYANQNVIIPYQGKDQLYRFHQDKGRLKRVKPIERGVYGLFAKNPEQLAALNLLLDEEVHVVTLAGKAGTGKTLLALAAAMELLTHGRDYHRLLVSRPIFPMGRDMGYLPGDVSEKLAPWMQPIMDNLEYLANAQPMGIKTRGPEGLLEKGLIELEPLTYIRGRSISNRIMIVDEAQNLTPHELKTIVTRVGEGTKLILTGDPYQVDNPYLDPSSNGLSYLIERFRDHPIAGHVTLLRGVRSPLAELAANVL